MPMTRINVIPPEQLCDQHLLAEHRELTRIPNSILSGKYSIDDPSKIPDQYTVRTNANPAGGKGHCYFFVDKLLWLHCRYLALCCELGNRGFQNKNHWPIEINRNKYRNLWGEYRPTGAAIRLNKKRIKEQRPKIPRYRSVQLTDDQSCIGVY